MRRSAWRRRHSWSTRQPRPATAEPAADRVAVAGAIDRNPHEVTGFRQGLKEFGYVDGQNVVVDYRFAEGRSDRIAGLAAELMQLRPDVLVAVGTTVTTAIKDATTGSDPHRFLRQVTRSGRVSSPALRDRVATSPACR